MTHKSNLYSPGRRQFLAAAATLAIPTIVRAQAAKPIELGLIRNPVSGLIEVASKKGWFREAGAAINTTLFTGAAGPKIIQAMGGGSLGLSSVSATAAILALAGEAIPLRILSISTDPVPLFMLLGGPSVANVPSLAGKRVSAPQGTGLQYFLARVLAKHGMTMKDIEYVNLPAGDAQAAFLAGRIDAVVPALIGALMIQRIKPDTRRLFVHTDFTKGAGLTKPFINYDVFVAPQGALDAQRAAMVAFLGAYHDRAVPYLRDPVTTEEAIREINAYVNTEQRTPTDIAIMRELMTASGFFDRPQTKALMSDADFVEGLEDQVKFFMDSGQLKSSASMKPAVVSGLL
ncbi:MAG: ABC transporter substrate-binding protein [Rhodospirillales bacterium]|jgi:ABC-type nitrate/sulfonate/bicarbonate transport system substrate-binding protein